jgi:hypothetical protein
MSANRRLSRTQKRANKKREERRRKFCQLVTPYEGRKYQTDTYTSAVTAAETGIREADEISARKLVDGQVLKSLEYLVLELQSRKPEHPPTGNPTFDLPDGQKDDLIASHIKAHWERLFTTEIRHPNSDLTGILRTLMSSVQTRGSMYGHERGYLDFLIEFLGKIERGVGRSRPSLSIEDLVDIVVRMENGEFAGAPAQWEPDE